MVYLPIFYKFLRRDYDGRLRQRRRAWIDIYRVFCAVVCGNQLINVASSTRSNSSRGDTEPQLDNSRK